MDKACDVSFGIKFYTFFVGIRILVFWFFYYFVAFGKLNGLPLLLVEVLNPLVEDATFVI